MHFKEDDKMKFYNTETEQYFEIAMIDERTGIDCAQDLIGNTSNYEYDYEKEAYTLSNDEENNLKYWLEKIKEHGTDGEFDYIDIDVRYMAVIHA